MIISSRLSYEFGRFQLCGWDYPEKQCKNIMAVALIIFGDDTYYVSLDSLFRKLHFYSFYLGVIDIPHIFPQGKRGEQIFCS